MWQLIIKKLIPPTRIVRYCCSELKEKGGKGEIVVTGVRWAESNNRKNRRNAFEKDAYTKKAIHTMDNIEARRMLEHCIPKNKHILNPIIDWSDSDVWEFIKRYKIKYSELYDQGYSRLGCIGCPMKTKKNKIKEFERYPTYKRSYIRAFDKMLKNREEKGKDTKWNDGNEVFNWWING